jgi:hypothetical protein
MQPNPYEAPKQGSTPVLLPAEQGAIDWIFVTAAIAFAIAIPLCYLASRLLSP